jgi:hypothetical protein
MRLMSGKKHGGLAESAYIRIANLKIKLVPSTLKVGLKKF